MFDEYLKQLSIDARRPVGLYEPIDYVMFSDGKRIRPVLTLLACNMFSDDVDAALSPAVAFEVFHNFTLLHDDLMDNADVRRNRATVHKRWNKNTAILSGDAMLILAYQQLCSSNGNVLTTLLNEFSKMALEVCEGQQYDMDFELRNDVSINEYLNMIRLKTAVLLATCLKVGAICGGADTKNAELLYHMGISLGISFQIQDDWLDLYGDPEVFGKATGGDIISGKKTFLLLTAINEADTKTGKELIKLIQNKDVASNHKIENVKAIYDQLGVSKVTQKAIATYYQQAISYLQSVQISDPSRKKTLELFAEKLLKRNK